MPPSLPMLKDGMLHILCQEQKWRSRERMGIRGKCEECEKRQSAKPFISAT
jgi:hypothetical protein